MSEELDEYELSSINGELHVLFGSNRKWQKEDLNQIIGLLSRKIDLMRTTHYDISTLCQNVMRIEECKSFCVTFGLNVKKQQQKCDSVANVIRDNTQLLKHMQELIGMLNYFEQTYGFPTIVSESLKDYLEEVKHHCVSVRCELTQIVKKEEKLSMFEAIHHQKVKEFKKHEEALTDVISEIYHGIYIINIHHDIHHDNAAIAIIERYIKYLDQIIHVLNFQPLFGDDTLTDLDKCVLTPGCEMFNISREMSPPPIEILTHLKMKAERLLLLQQNMVSNWEQQQKQAWMNASMHKNQEMRNKARAELLTNASISMTNEDRLRMLAHSGSMKLLLDRLVQPHPSHYVHPVDQAKLKEMISDRVSSKRPRRGGSRKTKRRHKRSRRK